MKKKIIISFLIASNLACLAYLLMLGWNNSLLLDDFLFYSGVQEKGYFPWVVDMYFNWQGRFGMFFISGLFYALASNLNNLLPLTIIQLVFCYFCVYLLLQFCFQKINKWIVLLISATVFNLSTLGLLQFSTFFWVCTMPYITILAITILLIYAIINEKLNKFIALALIVISSFLVGGSAETYTPLVMLPLGIFFLFRLKRNGFKSIFEHTVDKRLMLSLVLLFVFFIIMLIAPGNKTRVETASGGEFVTGFLLVTRTFRIMIDFFFIITPKFIYYILAFPLFCWIGYSYRFNTRLSNYFNIKMFLISAVTVFLFFVIGIVPGIYFLNEIAPIRSLSYVSFVMVAFFAFWGFAAGTKIANTNHDTRLFVAMIITCLLFGGISVFRFFQDYERSAAYKNEINNIHAHLIYLQNKGFAGVAEVELTDWRRPSSSIRFYNFVMRFYKPAKIIGQAQLFMQPHWIDFPYEMYHLSTDPNWWTNQALRRHLNLDFDVVKKE